MLVPSYLEQSMTAFTSQQEQMREQISKAFGETPMGRNMQVPMQLMEEQVRRNTEMFQQAMQMFTPFAGRRHLPGRGTRRRVPRTRT